MQITRVICKGGKLLFKKLSTIFGDKCAYLPHFLRLGAGSIGSVKKEAGLRFVAGCGSHY